MKFHSILLVLITVSSALPIAAAENVISLEAAPPPPVPEPGGPAPEPPPGIIWLPNPGQTPESFRLQIENQRQDIENLRASNPNDLSSYLLQINNYKEAIVRYKNMNPR